MVINCPECSTKFRVASEKIPAKGAKLRCARCSHIFFVKPEEDIPEAPAAAAAAEETAEPEQETAAGGAAAEAPDESDFAFEEPPAESDFALDDTSGDVDDPFSDSDFDLEESPSPAETESDAFGFEEPAPTADETPDSATSEAADNIEFGFEEDAGEPAESPEGDFAFEEESTEELGLGANDEFDASAFETESPAEEDSFSFEEDYGNVEIGGDSDDEDQPFSFGDEMEADSGAAEQPEPEPEPDMSSAEAAASFEEDPEALEGYQDEMAAEPYEPLETEEYSEQELTSSVQSGKKRSPFATLIIFLLILILAIAVAGGVLYWQSGPEAIQQLYQRITGQEVAVQTKGQILVKDLQGSFVANETAGELLVIQGNAVNNYRESRAAIQVKGILFDNQGKQLRQKTIFCGNPISDEDLRKLSFDKLEEIMGNQFGESLVNLNVTPGQVISFTIVFRDIPENLSEFVVEVAGSNPAAQ